MLVGSIGGGLLGSVDLAGPFVVRAALRLAETRQKARGGAELRDAPVDVGSPASQRVADGS